MKIQYKCPCGHDVTCPECNPPDKPHHCPVIWNGVQCNGTPGHSGKHCADIPGFKVEWEPMSAKRKRVVFEEHPDGTYRQVTVAGKLEMVQDNGCSWHIGYCRFARREEEF